MKQLYFRLILGTAITGPAIGISGCVTGHQIEPETDVRSAVGTPTAVYQPSSGGMARLPADAAEIREPTDALTLRQALALTLARSPELAAIAWDVRIGEARLLQAGLRPNPELDAEVENALGVGAFRGAREAETTLRLSQLILLGGKRQSAVEAARLSRNLAEWDYQTARLDVLTGTAQGFIEVLTLQQQLALAEERVWLAEQIAEAVSERIAAARTSAVEQTRANVALATAQIELDQMRRELDAARQRLTTHWGSTEPLFARVEGNLEEMAEVPALTSLLRQLEQNPRIARWTTESSRREAILQLERSRRIPDVTVSGGIRRLSGPDASAFVAGVSVPLPLFDNNQGNILEAQYQLEKSRDERRATELGVLTALRQAWQQLSAAAAEVSAIRESVLPGAQQTLDTLNQYYSEGRLSYLEVLEAQRTLFSARTRYLAALSGYHEAVLAIERLTGEPLTALSNQP